MTPLNRNEDETELPMKHYWWRWQEPNLLDYFRSKGRKRLNRMPIFAQLSNERTNKLSSVNAKMLASYYYDVITSAVGSVQPDSANSN